MASFIDKALDAVVVPGFLNIGYNVRKKGWDPIDESLEGRVIVVTGATSGLGKASATELARLGGEVVLVGRNPDKTSRVRDEIAEAAGNAIDL